MVDSNDEASDSNSCESQMPSLDSGDDPLLKELALIPEVAKLVADMSILNPEVLRVTPVYKAFQRCSEAFRPHHRKRLYHKSRRSEEVTRFWSHSWHGSHWQKVLTLLVLYNGLASILLGTFAAFVMMCLFGFEFLPGYTRFGTDSIVWSTWSLATGLVVSFASFVMWKPQEEVFFDRICISDDPMLKAEAILSLAGILNKSKNMLVLWDPSWSDRLWCLFELAAFLKCKNAKDRQQVLNIRPTFVGPCSVAVFLTVSAGMLGLTTLPMPPNLIPGSLLHELVPVSGLLVLGAVTGFSAIMAFRGYFHSLKILEKKLASTSFDEVRSFCCQQNHVDAAGCPIVCDREMVKQCVSIWFGSTEAFEELIRSDVSEIIAEELRQNVFTRGWMLQVTAPLLWGCMDVSASNYRISRGHLQFAFELLVNGLVVWLLAVPLISELTISLTRRYCSQASCPICPRLADFFLKVGMWLVPATSVGLLCVIFVLIRFAMPPEQDLNSTSSMAWVRSASFTGAMLTIVMVNHGLKRALKR